ncbi:extracellular solute-binding protein [Siccirubricoccus deserti]
MADKEFTRDGVSRRQVLRAGAGVLAAGAVAAPMVHAQGTGGTLRCGFWDHWVPAGNGILRELAKEWGDKNRVDVQLDFVTSNGNQILLTINAQAQSRTGYDLMSFPTWEPSNHARMLEPVDDIMGRLIQKYGPVNPAGEYLGKQDGVWRAVPAVSGTQMKPPCVRFDLFKQHAGIDIREMWPAEPKPGPTASTWNWETFAVAAEKCNAAGFPFGLPMGSFTDAVDWVGALMTSYGAHLMDEKGNPTVRNNPKLRTAVDMLVRISKTLPNDVWAWDDGGNNRALISGRSALIFNPPSAWAVAKRDAPQVAEIAGPCRCRPGRRAASSPTCHISGASGTSAGPSRRRRPSWSSCRSASRPSGRPIPPMATTSRPSRAWPTSRCGRPKGRRSARSTSPAEAAPQCAHLGGNGAGPGGAGGAGLQPGPEHQAHRPHRPGRRKRGPGDGLGRAGAEHHPPRRLIPCGCPGDSQKGLNPGRPHRPDPRRGRHQPSAACCIAPQEIPMAADGTLAAGAPRTAGHGRATTLERFARRRSTIAFMMTLPLILVVAGLVAYPAGYGMYLSTLNRRMTENIGFGNFEILFDSDTFWNVAWQSCIFAITAVVLKALIGFWLAHMLHDIPAKGQRKWRGMLLIPWVIPPALSTLGWWWMFDPSYGSINWLFSVVGGPQIPGWASPGGPAPPSSSSTSGTVPHSS